MVLLCFISFFFFSPQYFGFTLYRHKLKASVVNASLVGRDVRDRGYVFVDGVRTTYHIQYKMFYVTTFTQSGINTCKLLTDMPTRENNSENLVFEKKNLGNVITA